MKAVVLVGGEGTRLRPLTCSVPKSMVPIVNRPFLEYTLAHLKRHHINEIILALRYLPDQIKQHFGDGQNFGVKLIYAIEESPLGTAGAVKNAASYLEGTFFVLNGDVLSDIDFTNVLAYHREKGALATITLAPVEDPTSFGVVETSANGRVRRFLEKPGWEAVTTNMVNSGCYVLEPAVLEQVPPSTFCTFEHNLFPRLLQMNVSVFGYPTRGYWMDIGAPDTYLKLNQDVLRGKLNVSPPGKKVSEGVWAGEGCRIHRTAQFNPPVVLGDGCTIGPEVRVVGPVVMGPGCAIGKESVVQESVLWRDVQVGERTTISRSVIGNQVTVGAGVWIMDGSAVADRAVVGDGNRLEHGMAVWPEKTLEPGAVSFVRVSQS